MTSSTINRPLFAKKCWHQSPFKENAQGVFWKLLACAGFAGVNCFVRYLTGGAGGIETPLPPGVVVLYQNIFGFFIMLPFVVKGGLKNLKTTRPLIHSVRIIAGVFGIISLYTAFSKMPMAQVVALQFTGPIFTLIGAKLYLGERVGAIRLLGVLLGAIGAFILTRPDKAFLGNTFDYQDLTAFLPLLSAALFVVAKLCNRSLGKSGEKSQLLTLYLLFFMIPVSGFYALYDWCTPDTNQLFMLVALGGFGCLAHYATAKAYSLAEVLFLTPFGFMRLLLTAMMGFILFSEFPQNEFIWYAIAFIVLSVIVITLGEVHLKRKGALGS